MTKPKRTARKLLGLATVAGILLAATFVQSAQASTYGVHECTSNQPTVDDAQVEGATTGYTGNNACPSYLQVSSNGPVSSMQSKAYVFTAPAGTRMNRVTGDYLLQGQADNGGTRPFFMYRLMSSSVDHLVQLPGNGSTAAAFDSNLINGGPLSRIGIGAVCQSGTVCPSRSGVYGRLGNIGFQMEDTVAPGAPAISGAALNGWINGTKALDFTVADLGSGVYVGSTTVNGMPVDIEGYCTPATDSSGSVKQMKPCPTFATGSTTLDTSAAAFTQGTNDVRVCAYEYGEASLQSGCKTETVKVDSIAPSAPTNLAVRDGEAWRRDNEFILEFDRQNQGVSGAPIIGASVRITGPGAYDHTDYYPADEVDTIYDVSVPAKGDYTAKVYLRDAAGNESPSNSASVHLRFDDTVPLGKDPSIANGWVSKDELATGYLQKWTATAPAEAPPSGIAGYRVVVNGNSDTDPCSGAGDQRACGAPITESGTGNLSRVLLPGDLIEGVNYVHVVPISGSGMRATDVRHSSIKADFTDPVTSLQGDGGGSWTNQDASVTLTAADALSGMQDTSEFPFDDSPVAILDVDGSQSSGAGDVSAEIKDEGVHELTWCARDLAGNGDCPEGGQPSAATAGSDVSSVGFDPNHMATVRIDKTAPTARFTNQQDPGDPDALVALVTDSLSGVASGQISYRQLGGSSWKALDTSLDGDRLRARVDSEDLKPATTYEFRAQSVDKANNTSISTSKQNGEPMQVTGPFRAPTVVTNLHVNGKAKSRIKYGTKVNVTGELLTIDDAPIANAPVDIRSTFAAGSTGSADAVTVTTDSRGRFATVLPKGPSRTVLAAYAGDRRYLRVVSAPAVVSVRSKVTLKVPSQVDSDSGIAFRGKVKAAGADLGQRGKRLAIQVSVGRKWKTVGNILRTNRRGAYRFPYRFTADYSRAVTYTFRAVVLREGGFPYLPSKSKKRVVTVTP